MRYYLLINVGALVGQISMVYAEKYVVRLYPYPQ
jgi:POT family proton-dependent oligopeptide transporter